MLYSTTLETPVGQLVIVASAAGVRAVLWPTDTPSRVPVGGDVHHQSPAVHPVLAAAVEQLEEWFAGSRTEFDLPLDPIGTTFQHAAWAVLRSIPYGDVITYGEQARRVGRPTAARAVGAANGRNPLSIVVPCHRVVGAGGKLTGFAAGLDVKAWLLDHERLVTASR